MEKKVHTFLMGFLEATASYFMNWTYSKHNIGKERGSKFKYESFQNIWLRSLHSNSHSWAEIWAFWEITNLKMRSVPGRIGGYSQITLIDVNWLLLFTFVLQL